MEIKQQYSENHSGVNILLKWGKLFLDKNLQKQLTLPSWKKGNFSRIFTKEFCEIFIPEFIYFCIKERVKKKYEIFHILSACHKTPKTIPTSLIQISNFCFKCPKSNKIYAISINPYQILCWITIHHKIKCHIPVKSQVSRFLPSFVTFK